MTIKAKIMDDQAIKRASTRIAHEILERNKGTDDLIFFGIKTRGIYLAERIAAKIKEFEGIEIGTDCLDITPYRDDLDVIDTKRIEKTLLDCDVTGKTVVLFDDVIYTGRTIRAAMDAIMDLGRPKAILLAVLVDRGHKELPIRPDFIGKNVPTAKSEIVEAHFVEIDGMDEVIIKE
ncbi:MAG: bifunctional pyr operon transcriptional regulator/uracil phosphoribosyltransferase PyrR [Peptostreptococcales bacterium]